MKLVVFFQGDQVNQTVWEWKSVSRHVVGGGMELNANNWKIASFDSLEYRIEINHEKVRSAPFDKHSGNTGFVSKENRRKTVARQSQLSSNYKQDNNFASMLELWGWYKSWYRVVVGESGVGGFKRNRESVWVRVWGGGYF